MRRFPPPTPVAVLQGLFEHYCGGDTLMLVRNVKEDKPAVFIHQVQSANDRWAKVDDPPAANGGPTPFGQWVIVPLLHGTKPLPPASPQVMPLYLEAEVLEKYDVSPGILEDGEGIVAEHRTYFAALELTPHTVPVEGVVLRDSSGATLAADAGEYVMQGFDHKTKRGDGQFQIVKRGAWIDFADLSAEQPFHKWLSLAKFETDERSAQAEKPRVQEGDVGRNPLDDGWRYLNSCNKQMAHFRLLVHTPTAKPWTVTDEPGMATVALEAARAILDKREPADLPAGLYVVTMVSHDTAYGLYFDGQEYCTIVKNI